ncbi:rna recognition motif-containing protein, partial [Cystoisospora suis]
MPANIASFSTSRAAACNPKDYSGSQVRLLSLFHGLFTFTSHCSDARRRHSKWRTPSGATNWDPSLYPSLRSPTFQRVNVVYLFFSALPSYCRSSSPSSFFSVAYQGCICPVYAPVRILGTDVVDVLMCVAHSAFRSVVRPSLLCASVCQEEQQQQSREGAGNAEPSCRVYVGNLSWRVRWQDLKDHMKQAGEVVRADVFEDFQGRSKGCGIVEYAKVEDAQKAIKELTDTELFDRLIFVREDREDGQKFSGGRGGGYGSRGGAPNYYYHYGRGGGGGPPPAMWAGGGYHHYGGGPAGMYRGGRGGGGVLLRRR